MVVSVPVSGPVFAQDKRVEVSGLVGWTLSDGVHTPDDMLVLAPDGNQYKSIDPQDSFKWGFTVGFLATENLEMGFQFGQQSTTLEAVGVVSGAEGARPIGDLTISTYHAVFTYNFLAEGARLRPYAVFGLGATNYGSVAYEVNGVQYTTSSATPFSWTVGTGVKYFLNPSLGFRAGVQLIPSYIRKDSEGWWCDPNANTGCFVVNSGPQYASQFDISGGVIFRF
jgi:hypothetical protein